MARTSASLKLTVSFQEHRRGGSGSKAIIQPVRRSSCAYRRREQYFGRHRNAVVSHRILWRSLAIGPSGTSNWSVPELGDWERLRVLPTLSDQIGCDLQKQWIDIRQHAGLTSLKLEPDSFRCLAHVTRRTVNRCSGFRHPPVSLGVVPEVALEFGDLDRLSVAGHDGLLDLTSGCINTASGESALRANDGAQ